MLSASQRRTVCFFFFRSFRNVKVLARLSWVLHNKYPYNPMTSFTPLISIAANIYIDHLGADLQRILLFVKEFSSAAYFDDRSERWIGDQLMIAATSKFTIRRWPCKKPSILGCERAPGWGLEASTPRTAHGRG